MILNNPRQIILIFAFVAIACLGGFFAYTNFADTRDSSAKKLRDFDRLSHVNTIAAALKQYRKEKGSLPAQFTESPQYVCRSDVRGPCGGLVNLNKLLEEYLVVIPVDPSIKTGNNTGYTVKINQADQILVAAPMAETKVIEAR